MDERAAWRLAMGALALMTVLSVLLTGSRGGAIGLGVLAIATLAFPLTPNADGVLKGFSVGRTILRCGLLIGAGAVAWHYLPAETQERMATLLDLGNDYNADPTLNASRTVIWKRDIGLAIERPIGYGLGSAELVDGLHGGQYRTAHNSLVEAFVELALWDWLCIWGAFSQPGSTSGVSSSRAVGLLPKSKTRNVRYTPERYPSRFWRIWRRASFFPNAYSPVILDDRGARFGACQDRDAGNDRADAQCTASIAPS